MHCSWNVRGPNFPFSVLTFEPCLELLLNINHGFCIPQQLKTALSKDFCLSSELHTATRVFTMENSSFGYCHFTLQVAFVSAAVILRLLIFNRLISRGNLGNRIRRADGEEVLLMLASFSIGVEWAMDHVRRWKI